MDGRDSEEVRWRRCEWRDGERETTRSVPRWHLSLTPTLPPPISSPHRSSHTPLLPLLPSFSLSLQSFSATQSFSAIKAFSASSSPEAEVDGGAARVEQRECGVEREEAGGSVYSRRAGDVRVRGRVGGLSGTCRIVGGEECVAWEGCREDSGNSTVEKDWLEEGRGGRWWRQDGVGVAQGEKSSDKVRRGPLVEG